MKPKRFDTGMTICKRGDNVSDIMLVKSGYIAVEVPSIRQAIYTVCVEDEDADKLTKQKIEVLNSDSSNN
jgi:hypothetical protein